MIPSYFNQVLVIMRAGSKTAPYPRTNTQFYTGTTNLLLFLKAFQEKLQKGSCLKVIMNQANTAL